MPDFNNQWIEIFAPGDYGAKGKFTGEHLAAMVRNFKSGVWTPPAVIGHPETDAPAHGWARDMRINAAGKLEAQFEKVSTQLEEHARSGRFPNRSVAIYLDPKGSGPVVRHIGFLGAAPPEVKGLAPIQFSLDGDFVAVDFSNSPEGEKEDEVDPKQMQESIRSGIREFFSGLFGEKKEARFSEEEIDARVEKLREELAGQMSEQSKKIDALAAENKTLREGAAAGSSAAKKAEVQAFIEKRKAANQWVPAFDEAGLPAVLEHLAQSEGTVKFGEAGKEKELAPYAVLTAFFEALPKIVPTTELVKVSDRKSNVIQFAEPTTDKVTVDAESVALAEAAQTRAVEIQKANPALAFHECFARAYTQLAREGFKPAGAISAGQA